MGTVGKGGCNLVQEAVGLPEKLISSQINPWKYLGCSLMAQSFGRAGVLSVASFLAFFAGVGVIASSGAVLALTFVEVVARFIAFLMALKFL